MLAATNSDSHIAPFSSINSNPFPGLQLLKNDMRDFLNSLEDFIHQGKRDLDANREAFLAAIKSDKEKRTILQSQIDFFERKREEVQKQLAKEREEVDALEREIEEISKTENMLAEKVRELAIRVEKSTEFYEKKASLYHQREERRKVKYAKAVPRVKFYEDTLGLFIERLQNGHVRFRFQYIDQKNPNQDCWLIIDPVNGTIVETFPDLNIKSGTSFDISSVKDIRQSFVKYFS